MCPPLGALRVFHLYDTDERLPLLTITPSTYTLSLATPTLSVAVVAIVTLPLTVLPLLGVVMMTVGGVVSWLEPPEALATVTVTVWEQCRAVAYESAALRDAATQVFTQQTADLLGTHYSLVGVVRVQVVRSALRYDKRPPSRTRGLPR